MWSAGGLEPSSRDSRQFIPPSKAGMRPKSPLTRVTVPAANYKRKARSHDRFLPHGGVASMPFDVVIFEEGSRNGAPA